MNDSPFNSICATPASAHLSKTRKLRSFLKRSDGTTAVEFAIMLALIVSGVILAAQSLGHATKNSLEGIVLVKHPGADSAEFVTAPVELQLAEAGPQPNWLSANQHQIERLVIIVLLVACFCLLRKQRRSLDEKKSQLREQIPETEEQLQVFLKRQEIYRTLSTNIDSLFNSQMQVQHLMSKRVATVEPQATVAKIKLLMKERQLRHLLVCNKGQKLVGIISDRDLYCDDSKTAQQVMSKELVTVPPDALISTVISLILKERISSLPIVSDDRIHGLLTTTDLIMAMQCTLRLWNEANSLKADSNSSPETLEDQNIDIDCTERELTTV